MTDTKTSARVLVLAEHEHNECSPTTARLISAAQKFGQPVDLLVAGSDCRVVAEQVTSYSGISRILLADQSALLTPLAEDMTALLLPLMQASHDVLLVASNRAGRELVPRLAARLDVSPLTDVVQIISPERFIRPLHAGAVLTEVRLRERKKLLSLRPSGFEHTELRTPDEPAAKIEPCASFEAANLSRQIGHEFFWDQPALEDASIIIGLGRGVATNENIAIIEKLAHRLGALFGGSRAAVERGILPGSALIGQSGKTIAPKLYIALGISGARQHLAGIRDAKTIIALNKDPDAPIFKIADYGLVGDLSQLLPELETALGL